MPTCELCDGETFESRNGLYYCLTCGTQSQDLRDEVVEEQVDVDERLIVRTNTGKGGRKAYERTEGKPWLLEEAYQIILLKQVEFLMKNGVDPRLKDVVGQLWFKYLSLSGIAFCSSESSLLIDSQTPETSRNKHNARALGKPKPKKKKIRKEEDDILELCSEICDEEFYQEDNPVQRNEKDESTESDEDDNLSSSESIFIVPSLETSGGQQSRKLQMRTTVALVYLGLLLLNEPIFLSDLLRWIREGHFPYLDAASFLPSYMKFSNKDSSILTPIALPTKQLLFWDCAFLVNVLKLSVHEQNMRKYTSRYILSLNLPAITHSFVNNLLKVYKPDSAFWRVQRRAITSQSLHYEETAMAYILIALKMCYGLDDTQDELEANVAKDVIFSESLVSIPVWKEWASASRHCQNKTMTSGVPWTQEHLDNLQDTKIYTNFCTTHIFGDWTNRDREMTSDVKQSVLGPKVKYHRKEYRETCAEIFSSLTGESTTEYSPTTFSNACRHGNETTNEIQQQCFAETQSRGIPLESLRKLCEKESTPSEDADSLKKKYIKYFRINAMNQVTHPSFRYLVDLMASHIESNPELLEMAIIKIESLLLDDGELIASKRKNKRIKTNGFSSSTGE